MGKLEWVWDKICLLFKVLHLSYTLVHLMCSYLEIEVSIIVAQAIGRPLQRFLEPV